MTASTIIPSTARTDYEYYCKQYRENPLTWNRLSHFDRDCDPKLYDAVELSRPVKSTAYRQIEFRYRRVVTFVDCLASYDEQGYYMLIVSSPITTRVIAAIKVYQGYNDVPPFYLWIKQMLGVVLS